MATIQNDRDILLQAASVRVVPVPIPMDQVEGLPDALSGLQGSIASQGTVINSVLNNTKDLAIVASSTVFPGSTGTITLTTTFKNELAGSATWSVYTGLATLNPNGNTCTVDGSTVTGTGVTIRARVVSDGRNYDAFVTLTKLGALSGQNTVSLNTQVTGQLASGNVSGLGALALLNTVSLNSQTTGVLNGATQVTNLGTLAYANAVAANQIGVGTLAANVIYSGTINASQVTAGSFVGKTFTGGTFSGSQFVGSNFVTAISGQRLDISSGGTYNSLLRIIDASGVTRTTIGPGRAEFTSNAGFSESLVATNTAGAAAKFVPGNASPAITMGAITTTPAAGYPGGMTYHSTHGFIFCDGTGWFRIAPSAYVKV